MGVPGFYRWAVKKVPGVRHKCSKQPWECDNLYLDFNGVVHGCANGWDGVDEDALFRLVELHILLLVEMCNPRVLLYVAIDGVAPRAKMNQQRSRRFRAAQPNGKDCNGSHTGFDRNAITPGTDFMVRLSRRLQAWALSAAASEGLRGATIVISDDRDPGEGEHKIMEVIRQHPHYTHVLVSADADLVFLGLVSPAEHVFLLREDTNARERRIAVRDTTAEASSPGDASRASPLQDAGAAEDYELLSVVAVRRFLANQFPGGDPQRLAADFVAMCCLAGNDFLPHIPAVDIYQGGIDRLLVAYASLSPVERGYLVDEDLSLVLPRWQELLAQFAAFEAEALLEAAELGVGDKPPQYKGPGPPPESWDGVSVLVNWAPRQCTAEEMVQQLSKSGCTALSATAAAAKGNSGGSASHWLVRFAGPESALKTIIGQRRIRGNKVMCSWVDPSTCQLLEPLENSWDPMPWTSSRDALVQDYFEFLLSSENLGHDAFLRRHVRSDPERFVLVSVFLNFQRMRMLLQDAEQVARILEASPLLEVRGSGSTLAVRAVADYSVNADETPDHVARQQAALAAFAGSDFAGAVRALRPDYYTRHRGPSVGEPSAAEDPDFTQMERHRSHAFLQGIEWVVRYYHRGCASWSWYFPAHYPPLCVSLFDQAAQPLDRPPLHKPFPPELQLLAVLPPQSAALLPPRMRRLLTEGESPIADLYPSSFVVDKKPDDREWQGVALLPFVDESRLRVALEAVVPGSGCLSPFEPAIAYALPQAPKSFFSSLCCGSREPEYQGETVQPVPFASSHVLAGGRSSDAAFTRPEVAEAAAVACSAAGASASHGGPTAGGAGGKGGGRGKGRGGKGGGKGRRGR